MHFTLIRWLGHADCVIPTLAALALVATTALAEQPSGDPVDRPSIAIRVIEATPAGAAKKTPAAPETSPAAPEKRSAATEKTSAAPEKRPIAVEKSPAAPKKLTPAEVPLATPAPSAGEEPLKPIPDSQTDGPVQIEAASFKGVAPGVTTVQELEKNWGTPKEIRSRDGAVHYLYSVEPFNRVEVICFQGKVASILIRFEQSFPVPTVAQQLDLAKVRPVLVSNEMGEILGQAYPERGVLLSFEPSQEPGRPSMKVSQIVLEPISAEPFALRAETRLDTEPALSIQDLDHAVRLQPGNARTHWLRSRVLTTTSELDKALPASNEAVRLDPDNPQYRVTRAQILGQLGRFAEAVEEAQRAVQRSERRLHVKARALCLLGDLAASSPTPDYKQAIARHMEAIKLADTLAGDPHPAIRLAAKEVLIDAHLGAAHDIAWGSWKEKDKAVTQWLQRASVFAEDLIKNDGGSDFHRLRVSTRALAACVGARGAVDPTPWTEDTVRIGQALVAAAEDPIRKAQLQWDLGMALYDALQIYQIRGQHDTAMKYGELAIEHLEQSQQKSPAAAYLLGRLYFRLGAVYALRDQNHRVAISWFEKAVPLLQKPLPQEAFADVGRHGETFVSMGVSYWETGQRDKALELTRRGVALMEQAVKQGLLEDSALSIAYGNLATMHRQLGELETANRFESMASKLKTTVQK